MEKGGRPDVCAAKRQRLRQRLPPRLPCSIPRVPLPLCSWFRLEEVVMARLVAGFARAGKVGAAPLPSLPLLPHGS